MSAKAMAVLRGGPLDGERREVTAGITFLAFPMIGRETGRSMIRYREALHVGPDLVIYEFEFDEDKFA